MLKKLLLIEDDVNLSRNIKKQLIFEGFAVDTAFDGVIGERLIQREKYDCLLFDINVPGMNGYELTQSVRKMKIITPIIIITSFNGINDKLNGFDAGADDYIKKATCRCRDEGEV